MLKRLLKTHFFFILNFFFRKPVLPTFPQRMYRKLRVTFSGTPPAETLPMILCFPFSNMEERERASVKSDSKKTVSRPERERETDSNVEDDDADNINVCSEQFDPLRALYSPTSPPLPFPNMKCFNNVAAYESFLKGGRGRAKPENVEKKRRKAMKGVADPERIERLKKLMVNNPVPEEGEGSNSQPRRRRQKPPKNVLSRMACRFTTTTQREWEVSHATSPKYKWTSSKSCLIKHFNTCKEVLDQRSATFLIKRATSLAK